MNYPDMEKIKKRITLITLIFFVIIMVIVIKAVNLQIFQGQWLSAKAANQYEGSMVTAGKRGSIFDTNHREMAVSIDVTSIAAYPSKIKDKHEVSRTVSKALHIDRKNLYKKLAAKKMFVWSKRHVTPKEAEAVKKLQINGIDFITENSRYYPNRQLAAQLLGFSGIEGRGLEGIEFLFDAYLKGSDKKIKILKDGKGKGFDFDKIFVKNSGNNIVLTIDNTIQYIAEEALKEAVINFSAKSGIAIIMNPKTGAVLSMAHVPFFNPNSFKDFDRQSWRNRAVTDQFEPGSTMKIFSAAAALETGVCLPDSIFFCENGAYKIGRNIVHDSHPHAWLSLQQIVKYSSNIGSVKVSEETGKEALYNKLRDFGFGAKTGIDLPGETKGVLPNYKRWTKIDTGTISFGHGVSASAIQLITAASAIANNGVMMKPYVVQAVTDQNGRIIKSFGPERARRVITEKTAKTMKKIMETVVTSEGTGVKAYIAGYPVCGKTGTAQKIDGKGKYTKDKYVASFMGFTPAENPAISVLVIIDEPLNEYYGGTVAAPVFKKIAINTLEYLNILPESDAERLTASIKNGAKG